LFDSEEALRAALPESLRGALLREEPFVHVLTHKDLHLHPWQLDIANQQLQWDEGRWVSQDAWPALGLPAPIRKLLERAR
jgi:A/G-specific adenine glycosylase